MLWEMWEKVKTAGSLENCGGAQKVHEGVISWGLLRSGVKLQKNASCSISKKLQGKKT